MKLSDYISDVGRVVAYYPNLKKITGSTTATVLLCQFIYWCGKSDDGWTHKDYMQIEEETGLTRNEQRTAKRALAKLGLLEIERKRINHWSEYRVNKEILNKLWEEEKTGLPMPDELPDEAKESSQANVEPLDDLAEEMLGESKERGLSTIKSPAKKGDLVDAMLETQNSYGKQKMEAMTIIRDEIRKRLFVNPDNRKWEGFIEFAYNMKKKNNESISRFIDWAIENKFDPIYWPPEKMRTLWPQAFIENKANQPREDFIAPLPSRKEEEPVAPMPRDIVREHKLF